MAAAEVRPARMVARLYEALHDPKTREQGQIEGDVDVTGVLRLSRQPGPFTPAPDLKTRAA